MGDKIIVQNKKARFNYELLDFFEAGIVLMGCEIKSIRLHDVSLDGTFILIRNHQVILKNMNIKKYEFSNQQTIESDRDRILLLSKKEIKKIENRIQLEKVVVIPTKLYLKNNYAKLEIAIGLGKKLYDKRETIKQRDISKKLNKFKG
ncbi:SsrA-binding protein SmpB [Spiroplasma endosymbiont of Labia minor]|uniref:SsrA-binding protein SmpB n=1 Tax=Spiroplasma endosymbiont of Labia minor TaxID=3066305 RepID=UPI0030D0EF03